MAKRAGTVTRQGKPCKHCGNTERYAKSGACVGCNAKHVRAQQYAWRLRSEKRFKQYGITRDHFIALLRAQNEQCPGCAAPLTSDGKETHIDHDHATGKVRGLLCQNCNRALGMVKDSVEVLLRLGVYLERSHGAR